MALEVGFFLAALLCSARCSPLGETTVCESAPNVLTSLGLGVGSLGLNLPQSLLLPLLSQTLLPGVGTSTVCDSVPNLGLPVLPNYALPLTGQSTVCETAPNFSPFNLPLPYGPYLPGGLINHLPASTTVCESATNPISPLGLPLSLPGLGLPWPLGGLGLGLPMNGLGLPVPVNGLGLPLNGLGLPLNGLGRLGLPML